MKQLASVGWASPPVTKMNQYQRAQHMQNVSFGPQPPAQQNEPTEFPWLKMCTPPRQVAVPGAQAAGVSPPAVAGGMVIMDVHAGVASVVGAPVVADAAAGAPMQPNAAALAPGVTALVGVAPRQEAAVVTPVMQHGVVAIRDQEAPAPKRIQMQDVAKMLREKIVDDKAEAKSKRDALKAAETATATAATATAKTATAGTAKASAPVETAKTAKASAPAKATGKAASAKTGAKIGVAAKAKCEPHRLPKVVAPAGGSCPGDDSLAYRGTAYATVRYYKNSTIYLDSKNCLWRLKPSFASRTTHKKSFKVNPKQAWAELVTLIRKLNP